jgi:transforming growth factor-beta-induced protein
MRKVLLAASALALSAVAFAAPISAQDDMSGMTIAEIVTSLSSAETPEFSTLLTAVAAADPAVLEALSDPEAELTVFAPTDAAFAALAEALGEEAFAEVLADPAALTNILLYHVVEGTVPSADLIGLFGGPNETVSVRSLQGQNIDFTLREDDVIEVDGGEAVIQSVDVTASNGVIHVISGVILPESRTLAELVTDLASAEEPEFSTLLTAVAAADPAVLEALSDPEAELTVFAPTDAAFAALAEALGEEAFAGVLADPAALTDILLYHVFGGVAYYADVAEMLDEDGNLTIEMLNGDEATISVSDMGAMIAGANIVATDVEAANGVVHVIDAVILPPTE